MRVVAALALALTLLFGTGAAIAAQGTPTGSPEGTGDESLYVLSYQSSVLEPVAGEDGVYTLTLSGAGDQAVYFGDRPNRFAGTIATADLIAGISDISDPVNAALDGQLPDGSEEIVIVEIRSGDVDVAAGTLTLTVGLLGADTDFGYDFEPEPTSDVADGRAYGTTQLFIDSANCHNTPWDPRPCQSPSS